MQGLSIEIILTLIGMGSAGLIAFVRLEGKTNQNKEKNEDNLRLIEKNDLRIAKLEDRHEEVYDEVRAMLFGIQKSISNVEGRLSINTKE